MICSPQASTLNSLLANGELGASCRREILGALGLFDIFHQKIFIFKFPKSNLAKPTSQVISINIKALKTIFNWAKILKLRDKLATTSYTARLASNYGVLATASDHSPQASDLRTHTGSDQNSPKPANSLQSNL